VELRGKDLSCYLNIFDPLVYLKSLYDHYSLLTKRVLVISQRQTFIKSFTHKMAGKVSLHQNCVTVALCMALCLSVCHKSEFSQNSCTNRGGFWAWEFAAFVDALCHQFIFRVLYSLNMCLQCFDTVG